jgi:hypothetical protein
VKLLWIATTPPCPPVDGGRLVQALTLRALAAAGVEATVVAPVPAAEAAEASRLLAALARPRLVPVAAGWGATVRSGLGALGGTPLAIARHRLAAVRAEVAALLAAERFDAVHVEQMHALPQAEPALARGLPAVLRAQNVESDLWRAVAAHPEVGAVRRAAAAIEARRLAAWEGRAVGRVAATAALTASDAARLAALAAAHGALGTSVVHVPAPFPARLDPAAEALTGEPAVVLLGSRGWLPNRDATGWFLTRIWPLVRQRTPGAVLHLFGDAGDGSAAAGGSGVVSHPSPADSRRAFAPGSILAVPLRIGSGVRMKILEAWARGVPVVATSVAAAGLDAEPGRELLLADTPETFATALARLATDPALANRLTTAGRAALAARHDPQQVANRLIELYSD